MMPIDPGGDPWRGTTYKGFAGGPAVPPEPPAARRRRPSTRTLLIGGVAAALVLGLAFGFLARPELVGGGGSQAPASTSAALAPPGAAQVPIAVNPPAPPPAAPQPQGKLETLPPELAAAPRAAARPTQPRVPQAAAAPSQTPSAEASSTPTIEAPPPAVAAAPAPQLHASFDCATARPGAEQVVCSDAGLAAADRQLSRAYRRALRSGVDPVDLRQEQQDWMAIREDAARRSRRAVADIYDQRIQELNRLADEAAASGAPDDGSGE